MTGVIPAVLLILLMIALLGVIGYIIPVLLMTAVSGAGLYIAERR